MSQRLELVSKIGFRAKTEYFLFRLDVFRSTYQKWSEQEIQRRMNKKDAFKYISSNTCLA